MLLEVEGVVTSGTPIPGDAPPDKQAHIFDFDDTLGLTKNANGVMLYRDGIPAHQTEEEALDWLDSMGVSQKHYLVGPGGATFERPAGLDGVAAYVDSAGLAKLQKQLAFTVTPTQPQAPGDVLYIDFTPSAYVDVTTTDPINSTIDKMKRVAAQGSDTMVITARASNKQDPGVNFSGEPVVPSNAEDMEQFLSSKGAVPTQGVLGVKGMDKSTEIIRKFFGSRPPQDQPDEIHFYDDHPRNTQQVDAAVSGKVPAETFIYGPGEFALGEADPEVPNKATPANPELEAEKEAALAKESRDPALRRILHLAGIRG